MALCLQLEPYPLSHRYTNFEDAFADFVNKYSAWQGTLSQIKTYRDQMWAAAQVEDWLTAFGKAASCIDYFKNIHYLEFDIIESAPDRGHFYESIYWAAQSGNGAGVDMAAIINAMLEATPYQIEYFIGIVDAYRQSIWNRPFNREFYAALARGFEEWE